LHKHNLNFKIETLIETRRNFENWLCSRNTMYKRDIKVWGIEFGDVRDLRCECHVTECMMRLATKDKHKDMIIASN
jgi:hypothetical protein